MRISQWGNFPGCNGATPSDSNSDDFGILSYTVFKWLEASFVGLIFLGSVGFFLGLLDFSYRLPTHIIHGGLSKARKLQTL